MISIAARAAEARVLHQVNPFRYVIVLTKTDKINSKILGRVVEEVKTAVVDSMSSGSKNEGGGLLARAKRAADRKKLIEGVSVIPTSSVSRAGAEQVWELIYNCVKL